MNLHIYHHRDPKEAEDAAKIIARLTTLIQASAALATALNERLNKLEENMEETLDAIQQEIVEVHALADKAVQQLTDQRAAVIAQTQTIATLRDQIASLSINGDPTRLHEIMGGLDAVKDELALAVNPPGGSVANPPSQATQNQPQSEVDPGAGAGTQAPVGP